MNLWEHWEHRLEIFNVNLAHSLRNTTMWTQLTSTHLVPLAMNPTLVQFMRHHLPVVNSSISLHWWNNCCLVLSSRSLIALLLAFWCTWKHRKEKITSTHNCRLHACMSWSHHSWHQSLFLFHYRPGSFLNLSEFWFLSVLEIEMLCW